MTDPALTAVDHDTGESRAIPFATILQQLDKGRVHQDMSEELRSLVAAVADTLKGGSVTLKISVAPLKDDPSVRTVTGEITTKLPKHPPRPSLFFSDDDFNLVREDPNQDPLWRAHDLDR